MDFHVIRRRRSDKIIGTDLRRVFERFIVTKIIAQPYSRGRADEICAGAQSANHQQCAGDSHYAHFAAFGRSPSGHSITPNQAP